MRWVGLLRGINVGGNRKVDMKQLAATLEQAGLHDVRTYINSGNVLFSSPRRGRASLAGTVEDAIRERFGFEVPVLLRTADEIRATAKAIPASWTNTAPMKCDVLFLWDQIDDASVLGRMTVRKGIDQVRYTPGAVIWKVDREQLTRSGQMKLAASAVYKLVTIRNCTTVRKLADLVSSGA